VSRGRDVVAIASARVTGHFSRVGRHFGTSLPGMVAAGLSPGIAGRIARDLAHVSLVSGTNGKTTTSRLLTIILERTGRTVIANPSGANLAQSVTTSLVARATLTARVARRPAAGVFEVDEAALPRLAVELPVTQLVLTNLFRDQLDRFGETNLIVRRWAGMLELLDPSTSVVYCADDPRLAALVGAKSAGAVAFGISGSPRPDQAHLTSDASECPMCGSPLSLGWVTVGHLGSYHCSRCGFARPRPIVHVHLGAQGLADQHLSFHWADDPWPQVVRTRLIGPGNAYNAAAAVAAAAALGVDRRAAVAALADVTPPFGRWEPIEIAGRQVVLCLVKNPASMDEVARVSSAASIDTVLFAVNDAHADGRDVSWYWDVNPAALIADRRFAIAGTRASDLHLRLKYGSTHGPGAALEGFVGSFDRPYDALNRLIPETPRGGTLLVVATYTALLGLRATLVTMGLAEEMPT